ncbi:MAG: DUF952 domain-containing protein [Aestuariivirga sp.]
MQVFYKILPRKVWDRAKAEGTFAGSGIDLADGYIHLSTMAQVQETAARHFAGVDDLVLVAVPEQAVVTHLKWEPSRGGALFPHVYGTIDPQQVSWVRDLPWNGAAHDFPEGLLP